MKPVSLETDINVKTFLYLFLNYNTFTKIQDCFTILFSPPKVSGKMSEDNEIIDEPEDILHEEFASERSEDEPGSLEGGTVSSEGSEPSEVVKEKEPAGDRKGISALFSEFMSQFQEETSAEKKIRLSIDFMRAALSNGGTPRFKDFWEGRRMCLPLFKENITPKVRSQLWGFYIELSTEAKRLKEILDEQSAFAVEQIELAIQALERDLEHDALLLTQKHVETMEFRSITLNEKAQVYNAIQKELMVLNSLASRVNAMRKEVVKTEMRIRIKNKLLERLSLCGDKIFPKRKELIKKISNEFIGDVDKFIESHFQDEEFQKVPLFALREEIKELQAIAKILTLNTHAFTETRLKLSGCWDKLKNCEKERKKETQQKRQVYKQNYDLVMEKIKPFAESCVSGLSMEDCNKQSAEILDFMRTVELGRDEVRALKDEIQNARRAPFEKAKAEEFERQKREKEAETLRREKINALKEDLNTLLSQVDSTNLETLMAKREELVKHFEEVSLVKAERQIVDRLLKQLKDAIDDKREKALLMLSDDDLKALEQLKVVLEERKARRAEVKNQLEQYRKMLGGSGFDFEKAMMYREMIETEKATLEKMNAMIDEIEEKIEQIEG